MYSVTKPKHDVFLAFLEPLAAYSINVYNWNELKWEMKLLVEPSHHIKSTQIASERGVG